MPVTSSLSLTPPAVSGDITSKLLLPFTEYSLRVPAKVTVWKANCYLQRPVPREGDHMLGQPYLLMKVLLGRWTGPMALELQYASPNFPTVPCNQIKPLLISRLRI